MKIETFEKAKKIIDDIEKHNQFLYRLSKNPYFRLVDDKGYTDDTVRGTPLNDKLLESAIAIVTDERQRLRDALEKLQDDDVYTKAENSNDLVIDENVEYPFHLVDAITKLKDKKVEHEVITPENGQVKIFKHDHPEGYFFFWSETGKIGGYQRLKGINDVIGLYEVPWGCVPDLGDYEIRDHNALVQKNIKRAKDPYNKNNPVHVIATATKLDNAQGIEYILLNAPNGHFRIYTEGYITSDDNSIDYWSSTNKSNNKNYKTIDEIISFLKLPF